MDAFHTGIVLVLLSSIAAGMVRVLRGPGRADRMLAIQMFGTTGVALLLVLARTEPPLLDVGIVLALLAVVSTAAFARAFGARGAASA